jgi:hypothetical protein
MSTIMLIRVDIIQGFETFGRSSTTKLQKKKKIAVVLLFQNRVCARFNL